MNATVEPSGLRTGSPDAPSPLDVPAVTGLEPVRGEDDREASREASDTEPFSALAFKIMADPYVGKLTYFRVYSGKLEAGSCVLNVSSGKNNTTELKLKQFIISRTFNAGFPLRLMAKDVRTADELAHGLGIATPLADLCAKLWDEVAANSSEAADHTEIIRYMEKLVP